MYSSHSALPASARVVPLQPPVVAALVNAADIAWAGSPPVAYAAATASAKTLVLRLAAAAEPHASATGRTVLELTAAGRQDGVTWQRRTTGVRWW